MTLEGKTALVTGAAKRLGRQTALELANKGSDVIIHARNSIEEGKKVVNEIRSKGLRSELAVHDFIDSERTAAWFRSIADQYNGIDILVNSACEYRIDSYRDMKKQEFNDAMALGLLSPLAMMNVMAASQREAVIINILDARIFDQDTNHASYHLAKCSLYTLTKELALEFAPAIRVNAVAPGIILPPAQHGDEWLEKMSSSNPMQSHGKAEDVVEAILYLIQASFVTGEIIFVDGGRHLLRKNK